MSKRKSILLYLLPLAVFLLAAALLFEGCTTKPTEAPSTTVITGTWQLAVSSTDNLDYYTFSSGGLNYGKIALVYITSSVVGFQANGVIVGTGLTAPESGYVTTPVTITDGYSYFVKTDDVVHYAKVTAVSRSESAGYITIGFEWILQTEANNRNLY